jgi:hypothetical protein
VWTADAAWDQWDVLQGRSDRQAELSNVSGHQSQDYRSARSPDPRGDVHLQEGGGDLCFSMYPSSTSWGLMVVWVEQTESFFCTLDDCTFELGECLTFGGSVDVDSTHDANRTAYNLQTLIILTAKTLVTFSSMRSSVPRASTATARKTAANSKNPK